eukprot:m.82648 g.82648  ORF g.82648 m.82648 type:complete len:117 (+) comp8671_c0_seq3:2313-2663(+)
MTANLNTISAHNKIQASNSSSVFGIAPRSTSSIEKCCISSKSIDIETITVKIPFQGIHETSSPSQVDASCGSFSYGILNPFQKTTAAATKQQKQQQQQPNNNKHTTSKLLQLLVNG